MDEDRDGPLFPFWATLSLELLGRATLAKVHPALLADPQQGENILYAFGYGTAKNPKSIPAKTLFSRCQVVVPDFTGEDFIFCMSMIERRNQELHTGTPAFDDFPTQLWLAKYFRICKILLSFQTHNLIDLFGTDEAAAAEKMITAAEQKLVAKVRKLIEEAAKNFRLLDKDVQEEKMKEGARLASRQTTRDGEKIGKIVNCPACGAEALLLGEKISAQEPKLFEGILYTELVILPTKFCCFSCELSIEGHDNLHAVDFGGQFTTYEEHDPVKYYLAGVDIAEYLYEDEYGNE
jgi:hypothetical protein